MNSRVEGEFEFVPVTAQLYRVLMSAAQGGVCDGFDTHAIASTLSLVMSNPEGTRDDLLAGTGLDRKLFLELIREVFPSLEELFERMLPGNFEPTVREDEACLRELLFRNSNGGKLARAQAAIVARRSLEPNHLWQDLGLRNRRELSWLMERHFERLSTKNTRDMKWKKFLYRAICRDEGFGLCVAPVCDECSDYEACFGNEDGEALVQ